MRVRILVISAVALLGLACPGPNNSTDAGTGGGSGGGFVGGAGGGGGGSTGSVTLDQFCSGIATSLCDQAIQCNQADPTWRDACLSLYSTYFCQSVRQSVNAGEQDFDGAKAAACLASLSTATCDGTGGSVFGPDCSTVTTGKVAAGGQCNESDDCAAGGCNRPPDAGSECDGVCGAGSSSTGDLGQPCYGSSVTSCNTPYWCDVPVNTCKNPQGTNSPCTNNRMCNADNYCNTTTSQCTALPSAGQACNLSAYPYCNSTSYCQFGATNTCMARGGAGATCTTSSQCLTDSSCFNGQCRAKAGEGGSCANYDDCQSGLSCDNVTRTCSKYKTVDAGSPCSSSTGCRDSWCQGATPNPDGGVGTRGTCNANYVGYTCYGHYSCGNGTYCVGYDAGTAGSCAAAGSGNPCQYEENCVSGAYCNQTTDTCAARAGPGGNCSPGQPVSCTSPYVCIATSPTASVGQCGTPGNAGTACFVGGVNQCKVPNECINGTCTATGSSGKPCYDRGYCFDGACQGYNPDAGVRGTCGAKLADGQPCREDFECVSSFCDSVKDVCASMCQ